MSEANETVADIVSWLRTPQGGENGYITAWKVEISDRIEAAAKRERELSKTAENDNSGNAVIGGENNAAAMREALEAVVRAISEPNDVLSALLLMQAEAKCKAALAAPPRNCDRFQRYKDALAAYKGGNDTSFGQWLFATVEDRAMNGAARDEGASNGVAPGSDRG